MHRSGHNVLGMEAFLCAGLVECASVWTVHVCVCVKCMFLVTVRGAMKKRRTAFVSLLLMGLCKETDRSGCTLCSGYSHCHNLTERHNEREREKHNMEEVKRMKEGVKSRKQKQAKRSEKKHSIRWFPLCLCVQSNMDIRSHFFVCVAVCVLAPHIRTSLLA